MLAFYILVQNAGMLLSGSMHESNDNHVLSTIPASTPSTTVMPTSGDLAVAVPQQSVWIPRSALLTSKHFAGELRCLNVTWIEKTLPVMSKAGNKFGEIKDVANPKMITDWATLALRDDDSKEAKAFPNVQKKIRMTSCGIMLYCRSEDQVPCLQPKLRFRSFSFGNRELGEELGKAVFKTFMIKVMHFVLMEFSNLSTHEWDIKKQMMAKIARRIEKLKQQHLFLSRCPKNEELFSKIKTCVTMVENEGVPSLKSLRQTMDEKWKTISSSQFHTVSEVDLTVPQMRRTFIMSCQS
jgi:hypothetical protein